MVKRAWCLGFFSGKHPWFFGTCWYHLMGIFGDIKKKTSVRTDTLWLCQNSYWKWPFIVDFPIKHGGSFHSYVSLPEDIFRWRCLKSWIPKSILKGSNCLMTCTIWGDPHDIRNPQKLQKRWREILQQLVCVFFFVYPIKIPWKIPWFTVFHTYHPNASKAIGCRKGPAKPGLTLQLLSLIDV